MNDERWLPVVGFEGSYEVSDHGRVRSLKRPRVPKTRILKATLTKKGYLVVNLFVDGLGRCRFIHRIMLEAFVGPCPNGMESRHLDGIPTRNMLNNLTWGTKAENAADKSIHGTDALGERNGNSKITAADALAIRKASGGHMEIAKSYGVSRPCVGSIKSRRTWRHLEEQNDSCPATVINPIPRATDDET